MRVKKYLANTEKEALEQIKSEMGNNAIILDTRKVKKGGIFGFFGKTMLEVTVASEQENSHEHSMPGSSNVSWGKNTFDAQVGNSSTTKNTQEYSIAKEHQFNQLRDIIEKRQREYREAESESNSDYEQTSQLNSTEQKNKTDTDNGHFYSGQAAHATNFGTNRDDRESDHLQELKQELNQTKDMMQTMMNEVRQNSFQDKLPDAVAEFYDSLLEQDVKEDVAREVISKTMDCISQENIEDLNLFKNEIKKYLSQKLDVPVQATKTNSSKPRIITMIGPTGVGKTTTVAKLAARYTLMEQSHVGLITIDTYRIAAVEQLKTYGDILSLPVEVVMTPQELKTALDKLSDKDVVIVDTAGRSHKNQMQMTELKGFIETCKPDITHLVLSMGTKYNDIQKIIENYNHIEYDSLILTKTDETDSMGNLINLLWDYQIGCSYLTTGQNVPDDLEVFSLNNFLTKMIG